jgi:uncharacterized BrkB/YihY/UPF0761 family membrane protein
MHPALACAITLLVICLASWSFFMLIWSSANIVEAMEAKKVNPAYWKHHFGEIPSLKTAVIQTILFFIGWFFFMCILLIGAMP